MKEKIAYYVQYNIKSKFCKDLMLKVVILIKSMKSKWKCLLNKRICYIYLQYFQCIDTCIYETKLGA